MTTWQDRIERTFHSPRDYLDAARDSTADADLLDGLAGMPYGFVQEAVAEHQNTRTETLLRMVPASLKNWGDHSLLRKIVVHPSADSRVYARARETVAAALAEGRRPYSVAIALAERGGLSEADVESLGHLAGASARLRHGLRRAVGPRDR